MAAKVPAVSAQKGSVQLEYSDDDLPMASDDGDHQLDGELNTDDPDADGQDDSKDEDGEDDEHDATNTRLKQAALRQLPAGPGPQSAAAAGKRGGLVADTALLSQPETTDAAILQIEADELLSETRAIYSRNSGVDSVVTRLREALLSMPEHEVSMSIAKGFIEELGLDAKDSLTIKPPAAVTTVGSYATHAIARPDTTVDIAVQLPTDFLVPKAHLNYRYHAHRAVYLLAVACHLRDVSYSLFGEQTLESLQGDPTRPVLRIQPAKANGYSLRLLPAVGPTTFALPRLAPDRNGVRTHRKAAPSAKAVTGQEVAGAVAVSAPPQQQMQALLATPHYNAGILADMMLPTHAARLEAVLTASPRLLDGLLLLKVWARRHGLMATAPSNGPAAPGKGPGAASVAAATLSGGFGPTGSGCLDGCVLAMLVLLLAERNKMAHSMTVLQVLRAALQLLADTSAWSKGLTLARQEAATTGLPSGSTPPPLQIFKAHHQVVFLDFTGWLNVAAHMTRGSLAHVQLVARRTLELLTHPADPDEAFAAALLTPCSPAVAFDYHWRVSLPHGALWPLTTMEASSRQTDGATVEASSANVCRDRVLWREQEIQIEQLVRQALTDRAKVVRVLRRPLSQSVVPDDLKMGMTPLAGPAAPSDVWVGAVMDPLAACRLVDVGPAADDGPAAARFRRFWGEKSELRRWQDGKITETAVWELPAHERHVIPDRILAHVVNRHLPLGSAVAGAAGCLDWSLECRTSPPGADLAAMRAAEAASEKLGKQLRALEGLPLKVISVQPLSAVARGTAPLPPQPHPLAGGSAAAAASAAPGGCGLPRCLDPMEVLVTLENSGRWPEEPTAFNKMKAALGLQLASSLASSYGHHVTASEEAVDVLLDGFAFRLVLYSGRDEAMLTKASATAAATPAASLPGQPLVSPPAANGVSGSVLGSGLLSPEESPLLLSWHHGLVSLVAGGNAAFAPAARLAGRWVAVHMMSNHVAPQAVELLVAAAFTGMGSPGIPPPGSRISGFLRFLQLLARWPWKLQPLVVDPTGELREADRRAIRSRFEARRAAGDGAALYICTPRDRESRHWTQRGPSAGALQRLSVLAVRSAALLQLLLQPQATTPVDSAAAHPSSVPHYTPSGLPAEWSAIFSTPASDFDAYLLLRKEALPHADQALPLAAFATGHRHGKTSGDKPGSTLASLLLPPGGAVHNLSQGPGVAAALDAPVSGPDALSDVLEDGGPLEPPPKRARVFLRNFPEKVVAVKGTARLQGELLVGFDPVARLLADLGVSYGHLATFCVDGMGGRLVGVRWAPEGFLPQPLRLNGAHTALPLLLTGSVEEQAGGNEGTKLCVPNVFAVMREVKELGLGLVEDWLMPPLSAKARAAW